ncbi:MAG: DUF5702 domain-containing protein [Turicibacter sp.]|nr:DUF5702 domain-containing protein [Turicibacter sp.]
MKKKKLGVRGSINVFVALMMVPVMVFTGVMVDFSRMLMANTMINNAAALAAHSIIANYDGLLLEVFGLLATSQSDSTEAERFANVASHVSLGLEMNGERMGGNNFNLLGNLEINDVTVGPNDERYTLNNMAMLQSLLTEYMRFRIVLSLLGMEGIAETAEAVEDAEETTFDDSTARAERDFIQSGAYQHVGVLLQEAHKSYARLLTAMFGCNEPGFEIFIGRIQAHNLIPNFCSPQQIGFQAEREQHIATLRILIQNIEDGRTHLASIGIHIDELNEEIAELREEIAELREDISELRDLIEDEADPDTLELLRQLLAVRINNLEGLENDLEDLDNDLENLLEAEIEQQIVVMNMLVALEEEIDRFHDEVLQPLHNLATAVDTANSNLRNTITGALNQLNNQAENFSDAFIQANTRYLNGIFNGFDFWSTLEPEDRIGLNQEYFILPAVAYNDENFAGTILSNMITFTEPYAVEVVPHPSMVGEAELLNPEFILVFRLEPEPPTIFSTTVAQQPWQELKRILVVEPDEDLENEARREQENSEADNRIPDSSPGNEDANAEDTNVEGIVESDGPNTRPNLGDLPNIPAAYRSNRQNAGTTQTSLLAGWGNSLINSALLKEYGVQMFSNFVTNRRLEDGEQLTGERTLSGIPISPEMNHWYGAELEFLFAGRDSAQANFNIVIAVLSTLFFARNVLYTFRSPALKAEILALKAIPFVGWALSIAYRLFLAANETHIDIQTLLDGGRVPILKDHRRLKAGQPTQWRSGVAYSAAENIWGTTLPHRGSQGVLAENATEGEGWYYYQYLRFMLLLRRNDIVTERIATLIELNMNHYMSGGNLPPTPTEFRLANAYLLADVTIDATVPNFFIGNPFSRNLTGDENQSSNFQVTATATRGY